MAIRDANHERQGAVWPVRNIVSIDRLAKMADVGTLPVVFVSIGSANFKWVDYPRQGVNAGSSWAPVGVDRCQPPTLAKESPQNSRLLVVGM